VVPQLPTAVPPRRRRNRTPLLAAATVAVAALGLAAWQWWPSGAPDRLAVESVTAALDPPSGAGSCPSAEYRVSAEVATNGGAGTIDFSWELPDGRTSPADSVSVAAGQERVELSLSFDVTADAPVSGQPVLVLTAPDPQRVSAPAVAYTC
jgi:hypothetical protein